VAWYCYQTHPPVCPSVYNALVLCSASLTVSYMSCSEQINIMTATMMTLQAETAMEEC